MATESIDCSIAHIHIEVEGQVVELDVPAFTRPLRDFTAATMDAFDTYTTMTRESGSGMSLADFAMYLLSKASQEPRVQ